MRRLLSSLGASLIAVALVFSIGLAAIWHRTLHTLDSVQYITLDGTVYSVGTSVASITFSKATRYTELLRENHVDWLWSATPGWSSQTFQYNKPYPPPKPATQPAGAVHARTEFIRPMPWNRRLIGFEFGSDIVTFHSGGKNAICQDSYMTLPLWFLILLTASPALIWAYFRFSR